MVDYWTKWTGLGSGVPQNHHMVKAPVAGRSEKGGTDREKDENQPQIPFPLCGTGMTTQKSALLC